MLNFRVCFSSFIALTFSMCRGLELLQKGQMRSQKGTVIWEKGGPENWWRMWAMAINLGNSSFFGFCAGFTFRRIAWEPLLHVWLMVFPQFWIPVNLSSLEFKADFWPPSVLGRGDIQRDFVQTLDIVSLETEKAVSVTQRSSQLWDSPLHHFTEKRC